MNPITFQFDANKNTQWGVKVFIHQSHRALIRASLDYDFEESSGEAYAFAETYPFKKAMNNKESVFAELHFSRGKYLTMPIIAHECYHAMIWYCKLTKLKIHEANIDGEEWAADTIEYLVSGVLVGLKKHKVKVR